LTYSISTLAISHAILLRQELLPPPLENGKSDTLNQQEARKIYRLKNVKDSDFFSEREVLLRKWKVVKRSSRQI
jgi:hypothetical protein